MASNYPGSLDSFDTIASDKKTSDSVGGRTHRQMHNDLGDAIESVQTELGTNPSGSDATVAARLDAAEAGIGNLLTANQASIEYGTTGLEAWNSCTISRSADVPLHGSYGLKVTPTGASPIAGIAAPGVPVTPGRAYTFVTDLYVTAAATMNGVIYWRKSDNTLISVSASPNIVFTGEDREWAVVNATAPALAAYAMVGAQSTDAVHAFYMDCLGFWEGTSTAKSWAMPGTPIVGLSHIATNGAYVSSGAFTPEGVITAPPLSRFQQTSGAITATGAMEWVKASGTGNTGWVAGAEADTGWRLVAVTGSGWTGNLLMRRYGATVTVVSDSGNLTAAASGSDLIMNIPVGLRPSTNGYTFYQTYNLSSGLNWIALGDPSGAINFHGTRSAGDSMALEATFQTSTAWLSSLPGSAA